MYRSARHILFWARLLLTVLVPGGATLARRHSSPKRTWWKQMGCALAALASISAVNAAAQQAATTFDENAGRTLFAFDQVSIPFTQNLRLEMRKPTRHPDNPVLQRGAPGSPDSWAVQFYGSIIRTNGKFRMWYVAAGDERTEGKVPRSAPWRPAYAESDDGVHWTKPNLGLVEYRGNRNNNLLLMGPAPLGIVNLKVLAEPDDPKPERRYKMTTHVWFPKGKNRFGTLVPWASADGLRWKMLIDAKPVDAELPIDDLVLPALHFEPSGGLYKWDGMYYASGQNANVSTRPYHGRVVRMYHSPDLIHWSHTSSIGFVRSPQHTLLGAGRSREGEQTHEGISVWNRGNVLLGVYGIWHGAKEWKGVTIDLGFIVSNDGVHFREPAHEWVFLERGKDGAWDQGGLLQGQGFENVGEQTCIYYGAWDPRNWEGSPPRGGVGIATLPRDRFGDLVVEEAGKGKGDYQLPIITSEFITSAISAKASIPHRFYLNADGLGPEAALKVELLGADESLLAGLSGKSAALVRQSGFHTPIEWNGRQAVNGLPERIRIRATYEGKQATKIRFSALYVQADAAQEDAAKKDLDSLQGVWQLVSGEVEGKGLPADEIKAMKLTFQGNKATHPGPQGRTAGATIKLDPSQKPKGIDITPLDGPDKDKTLLGIYSIEGDTLRICASKAGSDRPTAFKAGKDFVLMVLKREKP